MLYIAVTIIMKANKVLAFLQKRFEIKDFVIEALDHNGYDTISNILLLSDAVVQGIQNEIVNNIQTYSYFEEYMV